MVACGVPFLHRLSVAAADADDLGHANNTVFVRWIQEAAVAHSAAVGFDLSAYRARGAVFVVRRHELEYLLPAFPGEALDVETRVTGFTPATSTRQTRILRARDGALLAHGTTQWAYVDLSRGRPLRIPAEVRSRFPVEPPVGEERAQE